MSRMIPIACAVGAAAVLLLSPAPVYAQTSAAEMLEQARARSRDMEELKAVARVLSSASQPKKNFGTKRS